MIFEHFALNVADAGTHARWYVQHASFRIVRQKPDAPFTHFLADSNGRVVLEIYSNPMAPLPDYRGMHPLCFHLALISSDARGDQARLVEAGASFVSEENLADGGRLIMLRDPWGVPLQLCQRAQPL